MPQPSCINVNNVDVVKFKQPRLNNGDLYYVGEASIEVFRMGIFWNLLYMTSLLRHLWSANERKFVV